MGKIWKDGEVLRENRGRALENGEIIDENRKKTHGNMGFQWISSMSI